MQDVEVGSIAIATRTWEENIWKKCRVVVYNINQHLPQWQGLRAVHHSRNKSSNSNTNSPFRSKTNRIKQVQQNFQSKFPSHWDARSPVFFELDRFLVQGAKGNIQKFYFFHANCPSSFIAFSKSMSVIYEYLHSQLSALQVFIQVWLYLTDPTSPYFDISTVCRLLASLWPA